VKLKKANKHFSLPPERKCPPPIKRRGENPRKVTKLKIKNIIQVLRHLFSHERCFLVF